MINATRIAGVLLAGTLLTGCATASPGARLKDSDALKARVDSLENQVASLSHRLEEVAAGQPAALPDDAVQSSLPRRAAESAKKRMTLRQTQRALAAAGHYQGTIDGKPGPKTRKAIKTFQQAQGLKADGIVGSATTEALAKYLDE